jgi:hypothetical protein
MFPGNDETRHGTYKFEKLVFSVLPLDDAQFVRAWIRTRISPWYGFVSFPGWGTPQVHTITLPTRFLHDWQEIHHEDTKARSFLF